MATVLLFHSVIGIGAVERTAAARWDAAGHRTIVPDLYAGERAATIEAGFALQERVGWEAMDARVAAAIAEAPADAVLAGVSMGTAVVGRLWPARPQAAGLLFLMGVYPLEPPPRDAVPLQLHLAEPDAYEEEDYVAEWVSDAETGGYAAEIFRYPGSGHLFADPGLPGHAPEQAERLWRRTEAFLGRLG